MGTFLSSLLRALRAHVLQIALGVLWQHHSPDGRPRQGGQGQALKPKRREKINRVMPALLR